MKKLLLPSLLVLTMVLGGFGFVVRNENFFEITRNIELLGKVYREISTSYVDNIDVAQFMRAGIDGMLSTLDPYTVFMDEEESDDIEQITTGKYAGIGVSLGTDADGRVMIMSITEGYAADKAGMRIGDVIIEVDGKNVKGKTLSDIRTMVRGDSETELRLKVEREGERKPLDFLLIRREITIRNVAYSGFVSEGIGYIKLERFSVNAAEEVASALRALQDSSKLSGRKLRGMILDLRDNPGGLLDAAVSIAGKFVPQGSTIVTTKGRDTTKVRSYTSPVAPLMLDVPLAMLIDGGSASASEIVAGAIQDLDRGVIIGTRSFGKGLVQTISRMPYNTSLKITTAKYYTPSGRLIQEVDYFQRNKKEGKRKVFTVEHDTVHKPFKTKGGRIVYDGGGITPDVKVEDREYTALETALYRKSAFLKFANQYRAKHQSLPPNFQADDALLAEFKAFLDTDKFTYESDAEKELQDLTEIASRNTYSDALQKQLADLKRVMAEEKERDFYRQKESLLSILGREIITRYRGEEAGLVASFNSDKQLREAVSVLNDSKRYAMLLASDHEIGGAVTSKKSTRPPRKKAR
ncbi:MAG: S41 family peptidase [Chloroherpetonaceae bacterium]